MPFRPDRTRVSDKELIGRRIFGDRIWDGYYGQHGAQIFRWEHFFDQRLVEADNPNDGLSFDRLGLRRPDRDVLAILRPIAHSDGQNRMPQRDLKGWAVIEVARLRQVYRNYELKPQPILEPAADVNRYHAVFEIRCYQDGDRAREIAVMLSHLASVPPYKGLIS
jgi:hypothetical protein